MSDQESTPSLDEIVHGLLLVQQAMHHMVLTALIREDITDREGVIEALDSVTSTVPSATAKVLFQDIRKRIVADANEGRPALSVIDGGLP